jgi:hypothetical protein
MFIASGSVFTERSFSNNKFKALNVWMIGNPLASYYTTVHVLHHRTYSGYMHREPISPGFAGTVPVLWVLNIVAAKKWLGMPNVLDFNKIIKNTKFLRMRKNILTLPR